MAWMRVYGKWVSEGEALGFDRPPRRFGMEGPWESENVRKISS